MGFQGVNDELNVLAQVDAQERGPGGDLVTLDLGRELQVLELLLDALRLE